MANPTSFAGSASQLNGIVEDICIKGGGSFTDNMVLQYFNRQLLQDFNPNINGYSLCFMVPPPFKGLGVDEFEVFRKLSVFASIEFSPPVREIKTQSFATRSSGMPYAVELEPSEQCTISFIDNSNMDIFKFHSVWFDYIHDLTLGHTEVPNIYLDPDSPSYGGLDYAGSVFVVKYNVSMQSIVYVGKVTGVYPQTLPNKEIIGQRSTNEIVVIPFTYFAGWYEETTSSSSPIWQELESSILSYYGESPSLADNIGFNTGTNTGSIA